MDQLKRAHSAEPGNNSTPETSQPPAWGESGTVQDTGAPNAVLPNDLSQKLSDVPDEALFGSPMKKQRPSVDHSATNDKYSASQSMSAALDTVISGNRGSSEKSGTTEVNPKIEEEEEL